MHVQAADFIRQARMSLERDHVVVKDWDVVEVGSRNINGRASDFWGQHASWWGIDIAPGPNVDEVGDAEVIFGKLLAIPSFTPFNLAVSCEVFEHAPNWEAIVSDMFWVADYVLITVASTGRAPHSAVDGMQVRDGEYYKNVSPEMMREALSRAAANILIFEHHPAIGDLYVLAESC